jgi:hypothetical protein
MARGIVQPVEHAPTTEVQLVVNCFEELRARVHAGGAE